MSVDRGTAAYYARLRRQSKSALSLARRVAADDERERRKKAQVAQAQGCTPGPGLSTPTDGTCEDEPGHSAPMR